MTDPIRVLCLGALMLAPAGCITRFNPGDANAIIDLEAAQLGAPSQWVFAEASDTAIAADWAEIIDDPALLSLIDEALANNPSLRATAENVARSRAFLRQSRSSLFPSLSVSASANGSSPLEDGDFSERYSAGVNASWEVDFWDTIGADIAAAKFDLAGSEAFYANARQSLIAQVARAYISVIESGQQVELTKATLDAQLETLRIVQIRRDTGFASQRELVLAQSDVASARDNLEVAEASLRSGIRGLQVLIGRYPDGQFDVPDAFPKIASFVAVGQPTDLLARRPDILTTEYDVRAALASEYLAGVTPSFVLSGSLDTASTEISDLFDPANAAFSIGARLADILFDGGLTKGRVEAAEAGTRQTLAAYGQTVLDAYADVEASLDSLATLDRRIEHVEAASDAARETLRLAEIQYREGAIDLLDVLTFRQRSFQADRTLLSIRRLQLDARLALYLSLGGAAAPVA